MRRKIGDKGKNGHRDIPIGRHFSMLDLRFSLPSSIIIRRQWQQQQQQQLVFIAHARLCFIFACAYSIGAYYSFIPIWAHGIAVGSCQWTPLTLCEILKTARRPVGERIFFSGIKTSLKQQKKGDRDSRGLRSVQCCTDGFLIIPCRVGPNSS